MRKYYVIFRVRSGDMFKVAYVGTQEKGYKPCKPYKTEKGAWDFLERNKKYMNTFTAYTVLPVYMSEDRAN